MTMTEMRKIAAGAARSQLRRQGIEPETTSPSGALAVLDDIYRNEPDLIASEWYDTASDNQIRLFKQEWKSG